MLFQKSLKVFSIFWLILFAFTAHATNYYLSNSGNDANSGTDPSTPWQTLNKLNSFKNLKPGDSVLFKGGDTFYGSITVHNSGTAGNPIVYAAYGIGTNPVISGFTTISNWTLLSGNIYYASLHVPALNIVTVNDVVKGLGRYPNSGYLSYESHINNTSITDKQLSGTSNWTGAEVVIRKYRWILDRHIITNQSSGTLAYNALSTYGNNNAYSPLNGNGYFIQGSLSTLDSTGEWYYDSSANRLYMYFDDLPSNSVVKASTQNINLTVNRQYITISNLDFEGASIDGVHLNGGSGNIFLNNCNFKQQGGNALYGISCSKITISNGMISDALNNGIWIEYQGSNITVSNVKLSNIGTIAGAGRSGDGAQEGILINGNNTTISNCSVINTGYNAISFDGDSAVVENNFVDTFCTIKDDGAGIYTYVGKDAIIKNNIILNAIGAYAGSEWAYWEPFGKAAGIYLDNGTNSHNAKVTGNTAAHGQWGGLMINNNDGNIVSSNTFFDFAYQLQFVIYDSGVMRNTVIKNNKFIAKTASQACIFFNRNSIENPSLFGIIDSNYYARPIDDNTTIWSTISSLADATITKRTLSEWQSYSRQDAHSKKSPKMIPDINDLRFEYNANGTKTVTLDAKYIEVTGFDRNREIELTPFSSVLLIKIDSVVRELPKANAGSNQTITLPANTITLSGTGTDSDGIISSYLWTKISGPNGVTMNNVDSASCIVNNLSEGVYQFELNVTENKGATAKDTITITVNPAINIPPTANAGPKQTIRLPVSSTILTGSATDSDGQISNYLWEKISGPTNYQITNPNSAIPNITGLTEGTYQFQLTVTDDKGATASSTVQILVNPPLNIPPAANADSNQIITLPTNKVTLNGSGTDSDGTMLSYLWTKISGPSSGTITNGNFGSAIVNNLSEGVYQFELKVTDDKGAVAKDTVQITVNAAPNIPPTSNAGQNQTITLPLNIVTLNGSGRDSDGTISSYLWTKISGPNAGTISNPSLASITVKGLVQGIYVFKLTVTDDRGAIGTDTVQVTVNAVANIPPVANAGTKQIITLPTNIVAVNGSGTDSDGTIAAYLWTRISGPNAGTISNPSSASTTVNGVIQGIYVFKLTVTDDQGAIGTDSVQITVKEAANIAPTSFAGTNQIITLPTNSVTLNGSGTDSDGTIAAYSWTKISGPSAYNISNSSSAVTTVSGLVQGVYNFQLKVADDKGAFGTDTVQITVNAAANIPPIADAGADKSITLPTNKVSISGSGSDKDGSISFYSWRKISGPSAYNIANSSSAITTVSALVQGIYQFELKVTDDKGAMATDTVQVTVNAPENVAPTAYAGINQTITLPINTVSLNGNGTDSDGTISSYLWTKVSGANSGIISNPLMATTTVKGLIQGIYILKLTVTDDKGAIAADSVQITVIAAPNIAPTVNAGTNQTIMLPINTVTLNGSGTDTDGTIASYHWVKISGPASETINNANSSSATVNNLSAGTYQFELTVADNKGATAKDTVQVIVNEAANIPPTANAGTKQIITLPANTVIFNGSGTDSDGTIASYLWTKIAGPAAGIITNSSSVLTTVKGLITGNYIFQLTVTDDEGAKGVDTMYVTVNGPKNSAPKANAGGDLTILLPVNTVYLNGSGNNGDGTITAYHWKQIAGHDSALIITENKASTVVKNLVGGTYEFELTITDNNGETGRDTVTVIVALGRSSSELNSIKIYPNPVRDIATMEITSENVNSQITLIVFDFTGKAVYKKLFSTSDYKATEKINMSGYSKGSYTVSVFFNEEDRHLLKIIKQ